MVFVKHFSVEDQTLLGLGHFYVHKNLKVSDLANMINEHMKYPPNTQLKIYEASPNLCFIVARARVLVVLPALDCLGDQAYDDRAHEAEGHLPPV